MISYYFVVKHYEKRLKEIIDLKAFFSIIILYLGFAVYSMVFTYNFWARIGLLIVIFALVVIFHKKIIGLFKNMKKKEKTEEALTGGDS